MTTAHAKKHTRGGHPYPCYCDEVCRAAEREYESRRRRLKAYGRWEPFTPAGPVREHVEMLRGYGLGLVRIARIAQASPKTVRYLIEGTPERQQPPPQQIRTETARKLLAVQPDEGHLAPQALVDATGTRRRIQGMVAAGRSLPVIAGLLGMRDCELHEIATGREKVRASTVRAVRTLERRLCQSLPDPQTMGERVSVSKARGYAARRGWVPAAAWDEGYGPHGIENPDASPQREFLRPARRQWRAADLVAEVEELAELEGLTRDQAAERIGVTRDAIDTAYRRARQYAEREQLEEAS